MITYCLHFLQKILFPSYCYVCKKENSSLCADCASRLTKPLNTPFPFITPLYSFKDVHVHTIIHLIKYFHRKDLIEPFTKHGIQAANIEHLKSLENLLLLPIPTTLFRRYRRGYCHTEYIAQSLSTILERPYDTSVLKRKLFTKQQVGTHRKERLHNQKNTFIVNNPLLIKGKTVLLVDDVTTTGATLLEARRVLRNHGASHVIAITLAH